MSGAISSSLGRCRSFLRLRFFDLVRKAAATDDCRQVISRYLRQHNALPMPKELDRLPMVSLPYPHLGGNDPRGAAKPRTRQDVIFVTGRYRSGSTLLWNLFRRVPAVTSYYEPFNERRWFDPAARGATVDPTHVNVDAYWKEYEGMEDLGMLFREDWKFLQLYMGETSTDLGMLRYIEELIRRAPGRPVLQFNEMDFRLPWLKAHFPAARIVHIYRHPREQWHSTMRSRDYEFAKLHLSDFERLDGFYLLRWGRDLAHYLPFLDLNPSAHPYKLFFQIWCLSYLFGSLHADYSLSLETLVAEPRRAVGDMFASMQIEDFDLDHVIAVVSHDANRSMRSGDDKLFAAVESEVICEMDRLFPGRTVAIPAEARSVAGRRPPHFAAQERRSVLL